MKLDEALRQYLSTASSKITSYDHQELHRFGRSIGLDRIVEALAPPEIAGYAEGVVAAGGDIHGRLAPLKEFLGYLNKSGLSAHSLAPHVKIPRATARAVAASKRADDSIQMTESGIALLTEELATLKGQREGIIDTIRLAAADKDFKENAPLDAARETQGKAEARIRELEETLRHAVVVTPVGKGKGIRVGDTVVLQDAETGKNVTYKLTDSAESDPLAGKISISSPIGQAMLGASKGQKIAVRAPKGDRHYVVSAIKA